MANHRENSNHENSKQIDKREQKNRLDELVNVVERYTRTERHLEQHSDIGSKRNIEHAQDIQREREGDISALKNTIINGEGGLGKREELENLEKNYKYSEGYLDHNSDHMTREDLQNLKEKQENRKEKIDELKFR